MTLPEVIWNIHILETEEYIHDMSTLVTKDKQTFVFVSSKQPFIYFTEHDGVQEKYINQTNI